jgi:hypothetical protein
MKFVNLKKHINCSDVAAEFLRTLHDPGSYRVEVSWVNIVNPKNFYRMGIREWITISCEQIENWRQHESYKD